MFAAAITGGGPVLYTLVTFVRGSVTALELVRWAAAHTIAMLTAAGFAFFGMLALHGVLLAFTGPRAFRRVSVVVQSATIFAIAVMFLLIPLVGASVYPLKRAGGWAMFAMPPLWFVGLYQTIGGRGDADWRALATMAWSSLAIVILVAGATHLAGFRRHVVATLETPVGATMRPRGWRRFWGGTVATLVGRRPARHALFAFTLRTLMRSPRHRLALAGFFGLGCAISAVALASSMRYGGAWHAPGVASVMSVQNILTFVLAGAVRFATSSPSELNASWVFRLLAPRDARAWRAGLSRAVVWCGLVPLVALLVPLNAALLGWPLAWSHAIVGLAFGAVLVEIVFFGWSKVPFACPVAPGGGGPNARWAFYWFGFTIYAFTMARAEAWILDQPRGLVAMVGTAAAVLVMLTIVGRLRGAAVTPEFEEQSDWAVQRLDLYG